MKAHKADLKSNMGKLDTIIFILWMGKLGLREIKGVAQEYGAHLGFGIISRVCLDFSISAPSSVSRHAFHITLCCYHQYRVCCMPSTTYISYHYCAHFMNKETEIWYE